MRMRLPVKTSNRPQRVVTPGSGRSPASPNQLIWSVCHERGITHCGPFIVKRNVMTLCPQGESYRGLFCYLEHVKFLPTLNPYNAILFLYKPLKTKGFVQFEIIIYHVSYHS